MRMMFLAARVIPTIILVAACDREMPEPNRPEGVRSGAVEAVDTLVTARGHQWAPMTHIDGNQHDLAFVGWAAIDLKGGVAVMQDASYEMIFFNADGILTGRIGRRGGGPSEFEGMRYAGWLADTDTLWIWDHRATRLVFVDAKLARVIRSRRITKLEYDGKRTDTLPDFRPTELLGVHPEGTILSSGIPRSDTRGYDSRGSGPLILSSHDGNLLSIVGWLPPRQHRAEYPGGGVLIPFAPEPLIGSSANGQRVGIVHSQHTTKSSGTFQLTILNAHGRTLSSREYSIEPVEIPQTKRDSVIDRALRRVNAAAASALRAVTIPEHYPPVSEMQVGSDGSVWLRLNHNRSTPNVPWLIVESGSATDTVSLPVSAKVMAVANGQALIRTEDGNDVHSLTVYSRVKRPIEH